MRLRYHGGRIFTDSRIRGLKHVRGWTDLGPADSAWAKHDLSIYARIDGELHDYQKTGLLWMRQEKRGIVADDMGLGKTLAAIAYMGNVRRLPALVVCPAYLKLNWESEIRKWCGQRFSITMLEGQKPTVFPVPDITLVNYDILHYWGKHLSKCGYRTLILDECHMIRNHETKRSKAVRKHLSQIPSVFGLTGTPVTGSPMDVWPVLSMIDPPVFSDRFRFGMKYCHLEMKNGHPTFTGAKNLKTLNKILKPYMIRRMKADVLQDLPRKQRVPYAVRLSNAREYRKAGDAGTSIKRRILAEGKVDDVMALIHDLRETRNGILVFGHHTHVLEQYAQEFGAPLITGETLPAKRNEIVNKYQKGGNRVLVGNMEAMGTGLNITRADTVVFAEYPWNPDVVVQCEDRAYRQGQDKDVLVYYPYTPMTLDQGFLVVLQRKQEVSGKIVDGHTKDAYMRMIIEASKQRTRIKL